MNSKKILYISYDGMCEPLGQSQVLAYLTRLASKWDIQLLSFEKPADLQSSEKMQEVAKICELNGIQWTARTYHHRPSLLATAFDVFSAWKYIFQLRDRRELQLVHCRSYVATLMGMPLRWFFGKPLIFDMRGFWADEKVDSKTWKKGALYRLVKYLEKHFLAKADHVISLTSRAIDEILSWPSSKKLQSEKFSVISTCVAIDKFIWNANAPEQLTLGYVGGARLWYDFPRVLGIFNDLLALEPRAKLHIVNKSEHEYIKSCIQFADVPMESILLEERSHSEMATAYSNFSFGVFFIHNFYSKKASMPTKLAEFMATGVPVITGRGIGDVDDYIEKYNTGVLLDQNPSEADLRQIIAMANDPELRKSCRKLAEEEFNLDKAIANIDSIYNQLALAEESPPNLN